MKNTPNLTIVILILLVVGCSCPKPSQSSSQNSSVSQKTISSTPLPQSTPSTPPFSLKSNSASTTNTANTSNAAKTASLITENAELRQSPNGTVIETLPVGASVEVIRQKGAWFYVNSGGTKGWLHGNAIRYDNQESNLAEKSNTPKPASRASTEIRSTPAPIEKTNPSGATAKCRDGTLSYSRNRRGTCSWHGGVAVWY